MIFSPFFHVICHAKSERFVDVKIERFFGPMTSCHPFFFIPIVAIDFRSDGQCVQPYFYVSYFEKRHVVHTYRFGWRMLVCWKINGIFVTKQSIDCFDCWLSKRQFWKIVADLIFHRSRFASDFCANVDGQYGLFFLLGPKTIDTTVNYYLEEQEDVTIHCTPKFRLKKQGMSLRFLDQNRHHFVG